MSNNWWQWRTAAWSALEAGELSQSEFIILDLLWERADGNHRAYLSHKEIVRRTGITRKWVRRSSKRLESQGWFQKKKRTIDRGYTYTFTLTMPDQAKSRAKWAAIRKELEGKMSPNNFQTYFAPLDAEVDETARTLTLKTPDEFLTSWLDKEWHDVVKDTAKPFGITTVSITTSPQ